jgi:radical SAM protein with 4Fe4S-binding SPASM domain
MDPDYIQFYPTLRCNQSCDFCFNRLLPSLGDMSLEAFRKMLKNLPQGTTTIDMIGGEPTLHQDIVLFIQYAVAAGFRVNISSNGTNLEVLQKIADVGSKVTVGISVNDRSALEHAADFVCSSRPVIKSVYTRSMDLTLAADILTLAPKRFYLIFRDAMEEGDLQETVPFSEFMAAAGRFPSDRVGTVYCSGFLPDTETYPELATVRCPAGTTKLGVMPDGSVYPCNLFFGRPDFLLGNILTDPFERIWLHPRLAFFRSSPENRCPQKRCRFHTRCHGGCPAHSLMLTNDLAGPDPRCVHREPVLIKKSVILWKSSAP